MNKPIALCCVVLALLLGCGGDDKRVGAVKSSADTPAQPPDALTSEMECRADDSRAYGIDAAFSPATANRVAFRCLRFTDSAASPPDSRDYQMVNIDSDTAAVSPPANQLQIPLHELKAKGFLKGRKLIIASDGKRFGAIERECEAIRSAGIVEVVALLSSAGNSQATARMSAREFVAERPYGAWRFVNRTSTSTLESPLFSEAAVAPPKRSKESRRQGSAGLVRTLVVYDSNEHETFSMPAGSPGAGQVFVLDGGLAGLEAYQARATAIARAQARPRIGERGCRG